MTKVAGIFWRRAGQGPAVGDGQELPLLPPQVYEEARSAAPGYDVYELEQAWREWWASSGKPKIDSPAAAFVGFCASRHKRAPIRRLDTSDKHLKRAGQG